MQGPDLQTLKIWVNEWVGVPAGVETGPRRARMERFRLWFRLWFRNMRVPFDNSRMPADRRRSLATPAHPDDMRRKVMRRLRYARAMNEL